MILKSYQINDDKIHEQKFFLLHGKNDGSKEEIISKIKEKTKFKYLSYEEKQILDDQDSFFNEILSGSLFDNDKIIIINRVTDKFLKIAEQLIEKRIEEIIFILIADVLEKRSKLRSFFEKEKETISIAFYPDNNETLIKVASNYLNKNKISISYSNINFIVNKCSGDRKNLLNELEKIALYSKSKKNIGLEELNKLINLHDNHSVNEIIDFCLSKNQKKTVEMLNENIFSNEDTVLITRVFINKAKKLLKLTDEFQNSRDINETIANAKPPIFWKEKEITKQQIRNWSSKQVKHLIFELNEIELIIKKNSKNALNFLTDFLLKKSAKEI